MKLNFFKKLILGAAIVYLPAQSMAWGTQGHRICGQIADSYLSPKARKAVQAILGNESVAMASNWADFIKSDPQYNYLYTWHFLDFDKPMNYPELQQFLKEDTGVDAYTKLQYLIADIKKPGISKENKLLDLRMIIHIVEDIHQPMHTAHTSDKGGNDLKVNWFSEPSNLHSVWDSKLIDFQQLSYTEYTNWINHTTAAERAEWQKEPISKWLYDSHVLAEKIYADVHPGDTLNYKYNFKYIDILNKQMLKAGVHLAGLLNQIFA
ncbi:S1/P1 nuclease [Mucilaginibacter sp. KACC 22063]|uniref:S1/P1 nuclease n=1 Tax=Mucilaginibacter sp. KACC 22063 TaxID=3025666 RepID=UPI0023653A53|nr:S1/P1 nuclease [Mucilaginibacter sp. KACC 22063]WDF55502.1 S1/P1 nuclease [Mucilaginibacter sp. KACC 22063]